MPDEVRSPEAETASAAVPQETKQELIPHAPQHKAELVAGSHVAPIVPRTIEEVARVAKAVIIAGLAPSSYEGRNQDETISKIMIGVMKGAEVGLPPITALSTIAIINNRPTIWGDGAVALCQSRGVVTKVETHFEGAETLNDKEPSISDFPDGYTAVFRIWRKGQDTPYIGRFSVRDARRAHLWGNIKKQPWMMYPTRMLMNRARAFALRDGFADCLSGLSIREEIEDLPAETPRAVDTAFLDDAPKEITTTADAPSEPAAAE